MTSELRTRHQAQQLYVRALTAAWRNGVPVVDPSVWLARDPEVEEKMLRDADIAHAVGFRRHLIAGQRWSLQPRFDNAMAPLAVMVGSALVDEIERFSEARMGLARAFFSGARFARIHGEPQVLTLGDGRPRTWWVPRRIEDVDKRTFRTVPKVVDGEELSATWERWDVASGQFVPQSLWEATRTIHHVYQDDQASLGHGRALRDALGWWWYAKTHVLQESLSAVERFAQGIVTAKVQGARDADTGLPNTELIQEWQNVLEDLRSRHVLVYDASDTVETIAPSGEGWQLLQSIRDELRTTIHTLVLGANLTTSASEGGSYALAEIQENSTEALIQFDRSALEETLSKNLMGCLWAFNHVNLVELGIAGDQPRLKLTQEKRQDPQQRVAVAQALNGMGVELALEDVLEQTGFRKPEPGEVLVAPVPQPTGGVPGFDFGSLLETGP